MGIKSSIYRGLEIVASLFEVKEDTGKGYWKFGSDNDIPNQIISAINESGTARRCVSRIASFVEADGFLVEETEGTETKIGQRIVNPKQTADKLLSDIALYSHFEAVILRVTYNAAGEIARVINIPFHHVRINLAGNSFTVNPDMGKKSRRSTKVEDEILFAYSPGLSPEQRIGQLMKRAEARKKNNNISLDELLYYSVATPGYEPYPVPEYYSGIEDIESDGSLQKLELRNIKKGFRPQAVVATVGEIDKNTKDDSGQTDFDRFATNLKKFTGDDANSILHIEASTKDGLPQVTPFDLAGTLDGVEKARERVPHSVCRHFGVPTVLAGFPQAEGLGNTQAIVNSMKLFQHTILKYQNRISEAFRLIWPEHQWTISTLNIIDFIPDLILPDLTQDERRALIGYPNAPIRQSSSSEAILSALNSMSPLIATKTLEFMTDDEIRTLIGLPALTEEQKREIKRQEEPLESRIARYVKVQSNGHPEK